MDRKAVKRLLAMLKAQVEYPERGLQVKTPAGFKEAFSSQPAFRGWINYHVTWDVDKTDVWLVVSRSRSLVAEWHAELSRVVPIISPEGSVQG
jgi:hypothetical protein